LECKRCGADVSPLYIAKRRERGLIEVCKSCAAKKRLRLQTNYGICWPHQGAFDANENPLDRRGKIIFDCIRLCGYSDCVNPEHQDEI
jgi:hypothetical protein